MPDLPLTEIKSIIRKHLPDSPAKIFIFGSRADGTARRWSDIDIGILPSRPFPHSILSRIHEELEESDIPYHVDVVNFSEVSKRFQEVALQETIPL